MHKILYSILFVTLALTGFSQKTVSINEFIRSSRISNSTEDDNSKSAHTISATATQVSCFGVCDGSIEVNITGGPPTYPVNIRLRFPADLGGGETWFNGLIATDFPFTISNLCGSGSPYEIRSRDGDNTWSNNLNSIYVLAPAALDVIEIIVDETCPGTCDGSITLDEVNGGTMPYVFAWSNGPSTENIASLCAGNYTLTLTDDHACVETFTFPISAPPVIVIDSLVYDSVFCFGESGSITVYASGGTPPYQYDIGSGYVVGNTFSGLAAGTYNITVQDVIGCLKNTGNFRFYENTAMSISGIVTHIQCFGNTNGAINSSVLGGVGPYTYSWTGPAFTSTLADITGLSAGTYDVTATDIYGCTATNSFTVNEPTALSITETHIVPCFGAANGSINITVTGGTLTVPCPNYTFIWSNAAITEDITNLAQGSYTVTVTDCNGCTATSTITLTQNPQITIAFARTQLPCFSSGCVGAINLTAGGGTPIAPPPAYTYSWTGPAAFASTNEDITNLCIGTYWVTVTDALGCTRALSTTITRPTDITINQISLTSLTCNSVCTGAIDINPTGGTPAYSYLWNGPSGFTAITQDVSSLCAGNYTVTVTDLNGCTKTRNFTITQPPAVTVTAVLTNVTCNGGSNGSISITVTNAVAPVSYSWTGPPPYTSTSEDISGLAAGTYFLSVTSTGPCVFDTSFTITEPTAIAPVASVVSDVTCFSLCNGSATVVPGGGTAPYTYLWCNGQTTQISTGLCAGVCAITVTDANLCTATASVTIIQPAAIVLSTTKTDALCNGQCNGTGTVNITSGGTAPFDYLWCNTQITQTATGLCVGVCGVTVTDDNGCTATSSVNISQPVALTATIGSQTNVTCFGLCNGAATVNGAGGIAPYSYAWCGGQTIQSPNSLCAGVCGVTITDSNGCTATTSVNITQPPVLTVNIPTQTNVTCFNLCNGTATAAAAGGTGPYTYSWSNGQAGINATGLCDGQVCVTVTDTRGCTASFCVTITEPPLLTATIGPPTNVTCFGLCNGSATVTPGGGTPGYTYLWSNGQTGITATGLCAGVFDVTVTDNRGCTATSTGTITQPAALVLTTSQTDVVCNGQCNGTATVIPLSGGTAPFTYLWSCGAQTTQTATGLCAGVCNVTVTDFNSCTATSSVTIIQPAVLTASNGGQTNMTCGGTCDGTGTITVAGGTPNYSYIWPNGETTNPATALCIGTFVPTVTDSHGCTSTAASFTIASPPVLTASISDSTMSCGSFETQVAGTTFIPDGNGNTYSTSINQTDFAAGQTIGSASDIVSVCLNMEHSWLGDLELKITCPDGRVAILKEGGHNTGQVYLGIPNHNDDPVNINDPLLNPPGTGFDYCFSNTPDFGTMVSEAASIQTLPAGSYTPFNPLSNLVGCPLNGNWTVSAMDDWGQDNGYIFSWLINFDPSVYPNQFCNGTITTTASGGTPPYTYFWSNGATTANITDLCEGNYCVTITDGAGCTNTDCSTIIDVDLTITSVTKTDASCNGICNGTATVNYTINGGIPVIYLWSTGATTATINNLCAGWYHITVSEADGCFDIDSIQILNDYSLTSTFTLTSPILCNGDLTGAGYFGNFGGTSPYTFLWSPNVTNTDSTIAGAGAGEYFITITDTPGCIKTDSVTFVQPTLIQITSIIPQDISCPGNNDGTITVVATGGTGTLTYTTGTFSNTNGLFTGLSANTYIVTVTDDNGCTAVSVPVTIDEPTPIIVTDTTIVNITPCIGGSNGSISIVVSGGNAPYQYSITGTNQASSTFPGLTAGVYNITVTDFTGCTITTGPLTVTEPTALTASFTEMVMVTCGGGCTGVLTITPVGGVQPYTYTWSPNAAETDSTASALCAAMYFITVTDDLGCTVVNNAEVSDINAFDVDTIRIDSISCFGVCDGEIEVLASGTNPPFDYLWSDGQTGPIATGLCVGPISQTVTDNNGCLRFLTFTLTQPTPITTDTDTIDNTCFNSCDGSAIVIASGGTTPYTYIWNDPANQTTDTATGLCIGNYIATVTDHNGCTSVTLPVTISEPAAITSVISEDNPISCHGICDGAITETAGGGTGPYSYTWSPNVTDITASVTGLCAGTYSITITDANLCTLTDSYTITEPDSLIATMTDSTAIACGGICTGTATVTPTGGTPGYTYLWDVPAASQTTQTATALCQGIFFVTVTDQNGCTAWDQVTIVDTSDLVLNIESLTPPSCFGQCDGAAEVLATGGYPPYTYTWSTPPGGNNPVVNGLCEASYFVTVSDDSSCARTVQVDLIAPQALTVLFDSLNPLCTGNCNGWISADVSGGTAPYSFIWDDPGLQTTDSIIGLCTGMYHVTITDLNNCSLIDSVELIGPVALSTTIDENSPVICHNECNGALAAIPVGGTAPYTYLWTGNLTDSLVTGLCSGVYDLTVTDANGCTATGTYTLANPDSLEITFDNITQIPCGAGACSGTVSVQPVGGTPPYTYSWSNFTGTFTSTDQDLTGLCGGVYLVTVTDGNNCTQTGSQAIIDTSDLALDTVAITNIACNGSCNGSIEVIASGGFPPYSYEWNDGQTGPIATNLCMGTYSVTVYDDSLCSRELIFELTDVAVLTATTVVTPITCSGRCDAEIAIVPAGGTPPYVSYTWSIAGLTDSVATLLCPNWYYFTVTDSQNCTFNDSIEIVDPGNFVFNIDLLSPIVCAGECSGSLEANPVSGIAPYQYLWNNSLTDSLLIDLCAGDYTVTLTDASGCSASQSYTIDEPDTLNVNLANMVNVACGGACTGSITIAATGGVLPYDYLWDANAGSATTPTVTALCANLYFVTVTDDNGCTVVFNTELTDTSNLQLLALDSIMVSCHGLCTGEIMVDATGGYLPYNFEWNTTPVVINDTVTGLCAGQYIVTVTDDSLCSRVSMFEITQPDTMFVTLIDSLGINCFGECTGMLSVSATGGTPNYEYLWSGSETTSQVANLCSGIYAVTLTDANGCTDTLSRQITEPLQITATMTITNALCSSGSGDGAIQSTVTGGSAPFTFLWSNDSTTQNIANLDAGMYYLTITDSLNCVVNDSAEIVPGIIVDALAWKDTTICGNDSVQIFGFGSTVFIWSPTTGMNDPLVFNPWVRPGITTTYYFTAYDSICFDVDSVIIGAYAPLIIDAGPDQTMLYDHPVQITGSGGTTGTTFEWSPATGLDNPNSLTTSANPESTTTYYLIATDENGCMTTDSLIITVIPRIVVPSGFTPNGDGMNDDWEIDMIHLYPNCEIEVYNRWGEQLFYSLGYPASERFDGTYKGKDLPIGTYYYIINLHDEIFTEPLTGPLTIMR